MALVIVLGILGRTALWSMVPVTADAVYHYSISRFIAQHLRIPSFEIETGGDPMWYPPLFHTVSAVFYGVLGSEKVTPLFASILSLFAFYILLNRFYESMLLPGMVLTAFLPTQVYYGAVGFVDCLFLLLAPLVLYCYLRFLERNDYRFLAASLLLSTACLLTHYHGVIPLLAISTHLFFRNRKAALAFLLSGLILASPWYIRNYALFGNPIWPVLFDGKYPAHEGYQPSKIADILSPLRWTTLFFEYWLGAPSSGEDFAKNVEVAGAYIPYPYAFFALWLAFVIALSVMTLIGLARLLGRDKNRDVLLLFLAFSALPLLLSSFVRMLAFAFPVFILGLACFMSETNLNRFFAGALKAVALAGFVVILLSPTFAYAFIYGRIIERYVPFYSMANELLPKDAVVCNMMDDVFFDNVERRIVSVGSTPEYRVTQKCIGEYLTDSSGSAGCFSKLGVNYACCTSLRTPYIGGPVKDFCDAMRHKQAAFDYDSGGAWGGCWEIK